MYLIGCWHTQIILIVISILCDFLKVEKKCKTFFFLDLQKDILILPQNLGAFL